MKIEKWARKDQFIALKMHALRLILNKAHALHMISEAVPFVSNKQKIEFLNAQAPTQN